jgi:hypothetical protein
MITLPPPALAHASIAWQKALELSVRPSPTAPKSVIIMEWFGISGNFTFGIAPFRSVIDFCDSMASPSID